MDEETVYQQQAETNVPKASNRTNFSGDVLAQILARKSGTGAAALNNSKELIGRHVYSFVFDGAEGTPEFFADEEGEYFDVKITLRSLSSREELEAMQGVTDGALAPFRLAYACLWKLNDKVLTPEEKELLWEGIGMKGRQMCLIGTNMIGGASASALGKFRSTFLPS